MTLESAAAAEPRQFRFGLAQAIYALAVLAAGGIVGGAIQSYPCGLISAALILAYWRYVYAGVDRRDRAITAGAIAGIAVVGWGFLGSQVSLQTANRGDSSRWRMYRTLENIAAGLRNYHEAHGAYPPPYLVDETDRRLHSWHVQSAQYGEGRSFIERYSFDEPWDSAANLDAATFGYRIVALQLRPGEPGFDAIIGPNTMWPTDRGRAESEAADPANTVLLVERWSDRPWTAPDDPTLDQFLAEERNGQSAPQHPNGRTLFLRGDYGRHVVLADGRVVFLPRSPTIEEWRQLSSVEPHALRVKDIQPTPALHRLRWEVIVPLTVLAALAWTPLVPLLRKTVRAGYSGYPNQPGGSAPSL